MSCRVWNHFRPPHKNDSFWPLLLFKGCGFLFSYLSLLDPSGNKFSGQKAKSSLEDDAGRILGGCTAPQAGTWNNAKAETRTGPCVCSTVEADSADCPAKHPPAHPIPARSVGDGGVFVTVHHAANKAARKPRFRLRRLSLCVRTHSTRLWRQPPFDKPGNDRDRYSSICAVTRRCR